MQFEDRCFILHLWLLFFVLCPMFPTGAHMLQGAANILRATEASGLSARAYLEAEHPSENLPAGQWPHGAVLTITQPDHKAVFLTCQNCRPSESTGYS